MNKFISFVVLLIVFLGFISGGAFGRFLVLEPQDLITALKNQSHPSIPVQRFTKIPANYSQDHTLALPSNVTVGADMYVISTSPMVSWEQQARELHNTYGITNFMFINKKGKITPGRIQYQMDGGETESLVNKIKAFEVEEEIGKLIVASLRKGETVRVNIKYEINQWTEFIDSAGLIVLVAIVGVGSGAVSVFGLYKMYGFIKANGGCIWTVATITLWVEIILNGLKLIYVFVDPWSTRNIISYVTASIISSVSVPWIVITTFLIGLWWQEILRPTKVTVTLFLNRFKWVFWGTAFVLITLSFIIGGLYGAYFDTDVVGVIGQIISIIMHLFVGIFLIITSAQVFKQVNESVKATGKSPLSSKIIRTTKLILSGAILHLILVLSIIIFAIVNAMSTPVSTFYCTAFWQVIQIAISLTHVFAFSAGKGPNSHSNSGVAPSSSKHTQSSNVNNSRVNRSPSSADKSSTPSAETTQKNDKGTKKAKQESSDEEAGEVESESSETTTSSKNEDKSDDEEEDEESNDKGGDDDDDTGDEESGTSSSK